MKKIIIAVSNHKPQQTKTWRAQLRSPRDKCAKCGKPLHAGDVAYRTSRKYLCEDCGKNAEIGD